MIRPKTERKVRGEWYKAIREDSVHKIRARNNPDTRLRVGLAVYFVSIYYKLLLRLPDVAAHRPDWLSPIQAMIDYSEDQLRLFAPYLKLQTYEPKTWTRVDDAEPL